MFLLLLVAFRAPLTEQRFVVGNPDEEVFKEFSLDCDPSSVAVPNDYQSAYSPQPCLERWRILTDLDNEEMTI